MRTASAAARMATGAGRGASRRPSAAAAAAAAAGAPRGAPSLGEGLGGLHESCVYLDWNATTPLFPETTAAMAPFLFEHFGNPSSGHAFARPTRDGVAAARAQLAALLGCDAGEIVLTSCGTESDNAALRLAAKRGKRRGVDKPHVVSTAVEHPAILECLVALEEEGAVDYTLVGVSEEGVVSPADVAAAVRPGETVLVSVMHANNETGAVNDVRAVADAVREIDPAVLVHTDAAQSAGKVPVKVRELGVDLATVVGHKLGAPKGVALLYVRGDADVGPVNVLYGGGQEGGRRAGTENVLHVVGFGAAADVCEREADELAAHMGRMRDDLQERLVSALGAERVRINGPADAARRLPNTLSISVRGLNASALLASLADDVAASAGAACHSGGATISAVLKAMDVPEEFALGTLRLSVGRHTTAADVERAAELILAQVDAHQRVAA